MWDVPGCRGVPHAAGVLGKTGLLLGVCPSVGLSNPAAFSTVFQIALLSPNNTALQMPKEDPWGSIAAPLPSHQVVRRKKRREGFKLTSLILSTPTAQRSPAPLLLPLHSSGTDNIISAR